MLRKYLAPHAMRWAKRLYLWALPLVMERVFWIDDDEGYAPVPFSDKEMGRALAFTARELDELPAEAKERALYLRTEEETLTNRLARRYDPGMALNEAHERARQKIAEAKKKADPPPADEDPIAAHYRMMRENPPELTATQQAALKIQEAHLKRIARQV